MLSLAPAPKPIPPAQQILVVDDHQIFLELIQRHLYRLGFDQVTTCVSPSEALQMIEEAPARFDLLVIDLQMPGLDGISLLRHLSQIPFRGAVIITSSVEGRVLETAERVGKALGLDLRGILPKPASPEKLLQLLGAARPTAMADVEPQPQYAPELIARALQHGEFVPHYQPQIALADGRLLGVEALARWIHPRHGIILPGRFIRSAEESGQICDLTFPLVARVLTQAREWEQAGLDLTVSVNISMASCLRPDFPDQLNAAIKQSGLEKPNLMLEITESRALDETMPAYDIFTRVRLHRIGLSIDDFGTGHSSLAQLRDVPFSELKVDQSFVKGAAADATRRAILEASLTLAHKLGMRTVGEGVETVDDWALLRRLGCTAAQGYLIAEPMPGEQLISWIADWDDRRDSLMRELATR
jgi:EAL domain-containing protein (putative c-di-GMP-specific phosphodiesterase class I)/ActR/RegA family two-component response regulator